MVVKKPRIVIIGAGMAGLTAANKLYTSPGSNESFDLCVVEGGNRIGGRINTSEFGGDRIEMGATWIHGIGGSPVHKIAQENNSLESEQPWECMDGFLEDPVTIAEGGYRLDQSLVEPVSSLFKRLMDFAQGKVSSGDVDCHGVRLLLSNGCAGKASVGSFLRQGLESYWCSKKCQGEVKRCGDWSKKSIEEAVFAMHENVQRTYTSAGDLMSLDYNAESEYKMFPGEEITIARGYLSIIESLASVLPPGLVQLGRKVAKIEWRPQVFDVENGYASRPVKLHFSDGSTMLADHVIITVSLGVLKAGTREDSCIFSPPLPSFKNQAISRLGFGVVNKLFLQLSPDYRQESGDSENIFPFLQLVFHQSESKNPKIPRWMRRTASLCPIYSKSRVLLSWFAGEEALKLESLRDEEILSGVETTITSFLSNALCNGNSNSQELKFSKVLKSHWGNDPLFLGSYSYVAVGSSGDDIDNLAEPLPKNTSTNNGTNGAPSLQILFAGEATHRTHYSTTHGAYFSGLREANRLLQHYHCVGV
ncbi:hypothetical protein LguiB_011854 [Lonicera macranthoides]